MKNLLLGLLLFSLFSCNTTKNLKAPPKIVAKDGYELKMLFQPKSEYVTNLKQVTSTSMSIPDMPEQNSESIVTSISTLKTGPLTDNQSELLLVYDEMDVQISGIGAQAETPSIAGMKIHGKLTDGVQSIDSIVGGDEAVQNMTKSLLEPMFSNMQINFPNPMKIGDEFLDTKVIELPLEGMGSSSITTETNYTLSKVIDNIAYLTTQTNLSGTVSIMEKEFPLKGSGSGIMTLDLEKHYSPTSTSEINQEMTIDMQGMSMDQKVIVSMNIKTEKVK